MNSWSALGILAVVGGTFEWLPTSRSAGARGATFQVADGDGDEGTTAALAGATWAQLIASVPGPTNGPDRDMSTANWPPHPVTTEIASRLVRGERPSDSQWAAVLIQSGAVGARGTWPVDLPWAVSMRVPNWLGQATIELQAVNEGFRPAKAGSRWPHICGNCMESHRFTDAFQEVGDVRLGEQVIEFEAVVRWGPDPYESSFPSLLEPGDRLVWEGKLALPVRGVPDLSHILPAATGPDLDAAVRRAVVVRAQHGFLLMQFLPREEPLLQGLALALEVELHGDGVLRERVVVPLRREPFGVFGGPVPAGAMIQSVQRLSPQTAELLRGGGSWTIRAQGVEHPSLLADGSADRHYAGSFELAVQ